MDLSSGSKIQGRTAPIKMKKPPVSSKLIQSAFGMSYARTLSPVPSPKTVHYCPVLILVDTGKVN
jgi:hypothetical protein